VRPFIFTLSEGTNSMPKLSYRAFLEVEDEKGERGFVETSKVLQSPELQRQCTEKAALRRIISKLQKRVYGDQTRFDA
jgi:hypothetical protein